MFRFNFSRYGSLLISVAIHAAIFLIAGSVIIYKAIAPPKATFQVQAQGPKIKPRSLNHQLLCKKSLAFQSPAREAQKLTAKLLNPSLPNQALSPLALPPPPQTINPAQSQNDLSLMNSAALGLSAALGNGPNGDQGFGEIEFLGQKVAARSVIILVDSSASIVQKGVFDAVRSEADRMVSFFHPDTLVNVILFTDGAYPFSTNLSFATTKVKQKLKTWLQTEMRINKGNNPQTNGSTPIMALTMALSQHPDVIFLISDDPPYLKGQDPDYHESQILSLIDQNRNQTQHKPTQINTIAYKPAAISLPAAPKKDKKPTKQQQKAQQGLDFLKRLASHGKGEFKIVE